MVSQTVEYALRAMSHLATIGNAGATSQTIAEATCVPQGYLSKVMRGLVCAGLVRSTRGRRGGFALARAAAEINLLDILNAVEPVRRIDACPLHNPLHTQLCPLHRCLDDVAAYLERSLQRTPLSSIITRSQADSCRRGPASVQSSIKPEPPTTPES